MFFAFVQYVKDRLFEGFTNVGLLFWKNYKKTLYLNKGGE